ILIHLALINTIYHDAFNKKVPFHLLGLANSYVDGTCNRQPFILPYGSFDNPGSIALGLSHGDTRPFTFSAAFPFPPLCSPQCAFSQSRPVLGSPVMITTNPLNSSVADNL
ncbi:hypothetical protein GOP47_0024114, partial [Adiantum capillus-veneris]